MSYISNVLRAVDYMERNLTCPVSVSDVASEAAYSTFHFVRLFKALTGYTPGSYLRRRRLTEAAGELAGGRKRIIEIALDYQFQSQEAFTRAFKDCFGINPSAFRKRGGAHLLGAARRIDELFLIHCMEVTIMEPFWGKFRRHCLPSFHAILRSYAKMPTGIGENYYEKRKSFNRDSRPSSNPLFSLG